MAQGSEEQALRDAAAAFIAAFEAAVAAGLTCPWPQSPDQMRAIAISETGAYTPEPTP